MKNGALLALVALLGLAVLLAATNPSSRQYQAFLEQQLNDALERMQTGGTTAEHRELRELLRTQGEQVIGSLLQHQTDRRNYGLFSLFETRALGVHVRVLGIAHRFVPLEGEEHLAAKLGQLIL